MKRGSAVIATALFLAAAPGTVAGLVPWLLSGWRMGPPLLGLEALRYLGLALMLLGLLGLLDSFLRFALQGLGTPAPLLPTERLVVTGLYRNVRNPMYVAVVSLVAGQGLLLGSARVLVYAALLGSLFQAFVLAYEEPTLRRRYGAQYDAFGAGVPRWIPRLRPWKAADPPRPAGEARALGSAGLAVLLACAASYALLGPPFYHFNDDAVMSTIVAGVGWIGEETHPSERAVFIHLMLGRALVALYGWNPAVPWYGSMLLCAVALGSLWLCFAGLRLGPPPLPAALVTLLGALVLFTGVALLHFGIAASLLAGGAAALAVSLVVRPAATSRRTSVLGAAALTSALFAALLRPESCWLGIATLAPLAALVLGRRGRRAGLSLLAGLLALALLHGGLLVYEQRDYAAAPGWGGTFEWMQAKRALLDHATIVYDERSKPAFDAAGWSANDFHMLRGWFVQEPELYGAASLRRLLDSLRSQGAVAPASLGEGRLRRALLTPLSAAALALALLIGLGGPRRERLALALGFALSLALLSGVAVAFRAPPARVHVPVWLLAIGIPVLWSAWRDELRGQGGSAEWPGQRVAGGVALAALAAASLWQALDARALAMQREQQAAAARRDLARLAGHREGLLLNWAGLFPVHELLRPFEPFSDRAGRLGAYGSHSFFWLGWPTRLPINQLWLARHGVRDLYEALYRRDDLLLLTRPEYLPLLERYLLEHRRVSVGHELVLSGETVSAYRLIAARGQP